MRAVDQQPRRFGNPLGCETEMREWCTGGCRLAETVYANDSSVEPDIFPPESGGAGFDSDPLDPIGT